MKATMEKPATSYRSARALARSVIHGPGRAFPTPTSAIVSPWRSKLSTVRILAIARCMTARISVGTEIRNHALGRYQMTPGALQAAGMMDRMGHWTGKYGTRSQAEFLVNPQAQERPLSDYMDDNERQPGRMERSTISVQQWMACTSGLRSPAPAYSPPPIVTVPVRPETISIGLQATRTPAKGST